MKKLAWVGIVILALVVLVLGAAGVTKAVFGGRYQAEIAAIKAKGEPLMPADLAGPPIPASEDAGVVYDRIHQRRVNGAFKSDTEVFDKVNSLRGAPMDLATRKALTRALAHSQPLIDLTAEAVSKPHYWVGIDWTTGSIDFPQVGELRRMCRILRARSLFRAQSGDMSGAADDITMQFRMAAQLEEGGTLMAQLIRVALAMIAAQSTTDAVRYGDLSESQARQVFDAVGTIHVAEGFRQGWLGERVTFLHFSDPSRIGGIAGAMGVGGMSPGPLASAPLDSIYTKTLLRGDQAAYLRFMAQQIECVNLSYREARARGVMDRSHVFPVYAVLSKSLSPIFAAGSFRRFSTEELLSRTQVFVALQAYKARFGGYPATMQELKTKLGWKLPVDPFSGKDFIYKRQVKGFILYSVGPDMKDDGGRALPSNSVHLDSKGDIVLKWDR